jgi:riboflavin kinase / FMN adenylyltransferase
MQVLHSISELSQIPGPVVLAFGVFDGVHLGHQEVIKRAQLYAKSKSAEMVLFTFSPHPVRVLRPAQSPRLLCTLKHELLILERMGLSSVLVCPFDKDMADTPAGSFIQQIALKCQRLEAIFVGENWRFGRGREGDILMLQLLGKQHHFEAFGIEPVLLNGQLVSSTAVRQAIEQGQFDLAHDLLGRPYTVLGDVVQGKQLGRTLGFPTANLDVHNEQLPPLGVYAVRAKLGNTWHPGVANLGLRPTVEEAASSPSLEVHLLDYNGNLYGQQLEVRFIQQLRSEKKFADLTELRAQIVQDTALARTLLSN